MATLAGGAGARITLREVEDEIQQLTDSWRSADPQAAQGDTILARYLSAKDIENLDRFDRVQLEDVLKVCESAKSLSDAGRELFAASRQKKTGPANDADRLRKYLARFNLSWSDIVSHAAK
jgi:transcriptional regulatory protein RtcR